MQNAIFEVILCLIDAYENKIYKFLFFVFRQFKLCKSTLT